MLQKNGASGKIAASSTKGSKYDLAKMQEFQFYIAAAKGILGKVIPADEVAVGRIIKTRYKNGVNSFKMVLLVVFNLKSGTLFQKLDKYLKS